MDARSGAVYRGIAAMLCDPVLPHRLLRFRQRRRRGWAEGAPPGARLGLEWTPGFVLPSDSGTNSRLEKQIAVRSSGKKPIERQCDGGLAICVSDGQGCLTLGAQMTRTTGLLPQGGARPRHRSHAFPADDARREDVGNRRSGNVGFGWPRLHGPSAIFVAPSPT
jgi:hypothetical protein